MSMFAENNWRTEQPKPSPPSNATEKSVHLSYFQELEKQSEGNAEETAVPMSFKSFEQADRQNEALFTAIMEDIGDPIPVGNFDTGGTFKAYNAAKVERAIRKALGLQPSIVNPQS